MAAHQRGVGERPEVLGRLELGRGGREEPQVPVLGHLQERSHVGIRTRGDTLLRDLQVLLVAAWGAPCDHTRWRCVS